MSLIAARYDFNSTVMTPEEQRYWMHFLASDGKDRMVSDYIKSQIAKNPSFRKELMQQPVCPRCEGFTFFHKGGAQCTKCGKWTPDNQTHSVKRHLKEGLFR